MRAEISTAAEIGQGYSQKLEKQKDETKAVVGHLKFSGGFVPREVIDALCDQPIGWAESFLFDDLGAPRAWIEIALPRSEISFTGKVAGNADDGALILTEATLSKLVLTLCDKGAKLAGELSWLIAGDEAADCQPLQGNTCLVQGSVYDSGQQDLLKAA